jgi:hypothetical protein
MQVLGLNKPKYVGAKVPFLPYAMNSYTYSQKSHKLQYIAP